MSVKKYGKKYIIFGLITPEEYITNEAINDSNAKIIEAGSPLVGMYYTAAL